MGLDVYISKKIFIGAMYKSCGITGKIRLFKHGKEIQWYWRMSAA